MLMHSTLLFSCFTAPPLGARVAGPLHMVLTARPPVARALQKKQGLAVSVELNTNGHVSDVDLSLLSMQLRKSHVASIWTSELHTVEVLAHEQMSAKGDFPGPCPIIFTRGETEEAEAAIAAGASAVVLKTDERTPDSDAEIIWDASNAVSDPSHEGNVYIVPSSELGVAQSSLSGDAVIVASLEALQEGNAEVPCGRSLAVSGCRSLLLRNAVVGHEEDLEYVRWAVDALTSKASSSFKIDGHTGAVNGHFGTRRATAAGDMQWKRAVASGQMDRA